MIVVAIVVIVGATVFAVAWSHRGAKEASLEEAVEEFRRRGESGAAGFLQPAVGVYSYHGTGTEKLSLLSTTQNWGPQLPSTVTRDDRGCWKFHLQYSTHHWQDWDYCPREKTLQEVGGRTFQSFDFVAVTVDDDNLFSCTPPGDAIRLDARPGDHWGYSCTGHSKTRDTKATTAGTTTFVRLTTVDVGRTAVPAYEYRIERTITGSQTGSERVRVWYSARDGLPLRIDRTVRVESPSPIGAVTYTEHGTCVLASLEPAQ